MNFDYSYRSGGADRGGASTPVDFRSNLSFIADDLSVLDPHCYISFARHRQYSPCSGTTLGYSRVRLIDAFVP